MTIRGSTAARPSGLNYFRSGEAKKQAHYAGGFGDRLLHSPTFWSVSAGDQDTCLQPADSLKGAALDDPSMEMFGRQDGIYEECVGLSCRTGPLRAVRSLRDLYTLSGWNDLRWPSRWSGSFFSDQRLSLPIVLPRKELNRLSGAPGRDGADHVPHHLIKGGVNLVGGLRAGVGQGGPAQSRGGADHDCG